MSVLETPRIYFRGQVAWDPITTNNYPRFYDEADAETVYPSTVRKVAAFRSAAVGQVTCGNWNPHGTHRSTFFDSAVSGADLGDGVVLDDPFVGSPARFMGMLVDLEPYGAFSSQLFFDTISFGIDGGYRITAPRTTRFTARYINFARNAVGAIAGIASVVWQTTFPKTDGLRIDAFDSAALQALAKALEADDVLGLTVQFNAYRTIYYDTPGAYQRPVMAMQAAELVAKLTEGGWQPNPARAYMVGTIGLWRKDEPVHEPCDRTLLTGPGNGSAPPVGSAHARIDGDKLVLDLSNSISETGLDLKKVDYGELTVVAVPSGGEPVTLGTFGYKQYDKDAYEQTSGIVTIPISSASAAATADLQVRDASGNVLLQEAAYRAIPRTPNQYLDQGATQEAVFQVYDRGVPAGAGVPATVCIMSADGGSIASTFNVLTGADGTFSFWVPTSGGAITAYVPLPGPHPSPQPSQGIDPQVYTYMYLRVLPADDDLAQLPPTWENVYSRVLANWHAMAPCMDNWLDLGDEAQVRAYAPLLKKLTAETSFEHFRYMPVTRDLTAGARTLLYNFLDSPSPEVGMAAKVVLKAPPPGAQRVNFARLGEKLRNK